MAPRRGKDAASSAGFQPVEITATGARLSREQAFRSYVEPQIEVLLRVAQTLTGSWADAEDIVQETLIRAWRAADRFDGAHPRAWLLTILRHTHLNSLRRQRPDLVADATSLETQRPAFGVQRLAGPEERQLNRTLDAALERAVAELDERYRTVLLLIDVDQLTYAEVAAVLDVPLGTVMSRLSRARAKVRRRLLTASSCEGTIR
ncbi:MAG TPA: sigma-70 family RNA polymerase sigma factor [Jatrophihabitantaceae bacterium]|nr:sigma-70 family RNA polymerase sigma factor [Jatrophihabitantaceae bacterium]